MVADRRDERVEDVLPTLPPRHVTLLLCDGTGSVLGSLPPFDVAVPWWQEVSDVVSTARDLHGLDVTVLRLLSTNTPSSSSGDVTYLAEVAAPPDVALRPWTDLTTTDDQPLRHSYARPGGPDADVAWADRRSKHGMRTTAPAEQIRTWNLSSVWRLPTTRVAWLKVVPPFMVREGRLLTEPFRRAVPTVLGHDGGRCCWPRSRARTMYEADTES